MTAWVTSLSLVVSSLSPCDAVAEAEAKLRPSLIELYWSWGWERTSLLKNAKAVLIWCPTWRWTVDCVCCKVWSWGEAEIQIVIKAERMQKQALASVVSQGRELQSVCIWCEALSFVFSLDRPSGWKRDFTFDSHIRWKSQVFDNSELKFD